MRRMSFALTTAQVLARTKTVTRRLASTWQNLKVGDRLVAVDKAMGLKLGESSQVLAVLRVVDVRVEPLSAITAEDVTREGFPDWTPTQFTWMLADHHGIAIGTAEEMDVRRIEFEYLTGAAEVAALGEVALAAASRRKARERKAAREAGWVVGTRTVTS